MHTCVVVQLGLIGCDVMFCLSFSYLVARDSASQKPVGFINFRFDLEQGVEVVYWCVGTTVCLPVCLSATCIPCGMSIIIGFDVTLISSLVPRLSPQK